MKKYILLLFWGITITLNAQVLKLSVPEITQEQINWCWAAVSESVLDYYGYSHQQCEIAEYTRSVSTWYNYGSTPCCTDASQGCNYGNYNCGQTGSIQDILVHFGDIANNCTGVLSLSDIQDNLNQQRPFIITFRKLYGSGGYHSVIGYGIDGDRIYYMDPEYGNKDSRYVTLQNDGMYEWFATNVLLVSPTPDHCDNCVQDGDETDIDCGGSCPPCQHAKSVVNYNYNTSSLPSETRAFETITAGNADVIVKSGQDVTFIAVGDVTLKPGFHAQSGSNFKVQKSATRKAVGADCGDFCEPHKNRVCLDIPPNNNNYGWNLANASSVSITIYQSRTNGNMYAIYSPPAIEIERDGYYALWDLKTGVNTSSLWIQNVFWYRANITTCKGEQKPINGSITLMNCLKSLSSDSGSFDVYESIIQDDISQNMDWLIFPNPNSGSFTISPENFQKVKQIQIINPLGQIIYSIQNPTDNNITLPSGAKGTYFVRITTETESITKKVLVE